MGVPPPPFKIMQLTDIVEPGTTFKDAIPDPRYHAQFEDNSVLEDVIQLGCRVFISDPVINGTLNPTMNIKIETPSGDVIETKNKTQHEAWAYLEGFGNALRAMEKKQ